MMRLKFSSAPSLELGNDRFGWHEYHCGRSRRGTTRLRFVLVFRVVDFLRGGHYDVYVIRSNIDGVQVPITDLAVLANRVVDGGLVIGSQ